MTTSGDRRIPPLPRRHIRRPRLTQRLDETSARIILLLAPAGYGKTSLACEWLETSASAAWYRCTSGSADVAAISVGIARSLSHLAPDAAERLAQRLTVPDSPDALARPLAEILASDLQDWPPDAWLVLDDYQLVMASSAVETFLDFLVESCPIKLLVATRKRPSWATARRQIYGELMELGVPVLAMTEREAATVLERSSGSLDDLLHDAGGWPAAIGLAALFDHELTSPGEAVTHLDRYLVEELLGADNTFVTAETVKASLLPVLDPDLCASVLEIVDPQAFLGNLRTAGFLVELGEDCYELLPPLRDFLVRQVWMLEPEELHGIALKALPSLTNRDLWIEAASLCDLLGAHSEFLTLLPDVAPRMIRSGQIETLGRVLDLLGAVGERNPHVRLLRAEICLRQGDPIRAEALSREVAASTDGQTHCQALTIAGRSAHLLSKHQSSVKYYQDALTSAPSTEEQINVLWNWFVIAIELEADTQRILRKLQSIAPSSDTAFIRVATAQAMYSLAEGDALLAYQHLSTILPLLSHCKDPLAATAALNQLAHIQSIRMLYHDADAYVNECLSLCHTFQLFFVQPIALFTAHGVAVGRNDVDRATALSRQLQDVVKRSDDPYASALERIARVRLLLLLGCSSEAYRISQEPLPLRVPTATRAELIALGALSAAAAGELLNAAAMADIALTCTRDSAVGVLAELVLLYTSGDEGCSRAQSLAKAVCDGGIREPLSIAALALPDLSERLRAPGEISVDLQRLLGTEGLGALQSPLDVIPGDLDPGSALLLRLTARERQVLKLLQRGFRDREIAEQLVISPATAKKHTRNILKKLGARSRLEAVTLSLGLRDPLP